MYIVLVHKTHNFAMWSWGLYFFTGKTQNAYMHHFQKVPQRSVVCDFLIFSSQSPQPTYSWSSKSKWGGEPVWIFPCFSELCWSRSRWKSVVIHNLFCSENRATLSDNCDQNCFFCHLSNDFDQNLILLLTSQLTMTRIAFFCWPP